MTTYAAISDADIDPESPITTTLMTRNRDNPIAITEGASGAPRIVGAAAKYRDDYSALTVSAADTYSTTTVVQDLTIGTLTTSSLTYVVAATINNVLLSGSARYKAQHKSADLFATSSLRVKKNGVVQNTWTTSSTSYIERTHDISVAPGDVITWEHNINTGSSSSSVTGTLSSASDTYVTRPLYVQATLSSAS